MNKRAEFVALVLIGLVVLSSIVILFVQSTSVEAKKVPKGHEDKEKVTLCHQMRNPNTGLFVVRKTITVGANAAAKHLVEHDEDILGPCPECFEEGEGPCKPDLFGADCCPQGNQIVGCNVVTFQCEVVKT